MSLSMQSLFKPLTIGNFNIPNRIVMAPMTRSASPNGVPSSDVIDYYRRRAENGVGLILTEGAVINHPAAANNPNIPRIYGEDALAGWAQVIKAVHNAGGKIIPQLWHIGMMRNLGDLPNPDSLPIGPSGVIKSNIRISEPMTELEINAIIEAFAQGALNAKNIGFDGIELHGAHGYLIDQFFWEGTNQRMDSYGGDITARTRFAVEIIKACRRLVGPDFPIIFRFSQWKVQDFNARLASTPELLAQFLSPLVDAGVDIFHCSTRRFWLPEFEGSTLNLAGWTKKLTGKPTITVGSIGLDNDFLNIYIEGKGANSNDTNMARLAQMIENEEVDLVAIGRALLSDPSWALKIRDGRMSELLPFNMDSLQTLT